MLNLFKVNIPKSVKKPLLETLYSGYIGQGDKVEIFEEKLRKFLDVENILTLNSGTSALHLALTLIGVKRGDEIISTPLTCTATNWPILAHNAVIKWADIDPKTGNIDPISIRDKITKKTKAIMVVDWGGTPVDMNEIKKIAYKKINGKKVKIPIIDDAAHAFGSEYDGKKIGSIADYTCFSFQAIKHITTIDGGALVVKNKQQYERGKLLRWYGIDRSKKGRDSRIEEDIFEWGYKFHMNDISAVIGIEQLKNINTILKKHRENAKYYLKELKNVNNLELLPEPKNSKSSYWIFTIKVKNRDEFMRIMSEKGIMTSKVHRRNDTHPVVRNFRTKLPVLDEFDKEMICIPVGWWISKKDRKYIVDTIKSGW